MKNCSICKHSKKTTTYTEVSEDLDENDVELFECRYNPPVIVEYLVRENLDAEREQIGEESFTDDPHIIWWGTKFPVVSSLDSCSKFEPTSDGR